MAEPGPGRGAARKSRARGGVRFSERGEAHFLGKLCMHVGPITRESAPACTRVCVCMCAQLAAVRKNLRARMFMRAKLYIDTHRLACARIYMRVNL